MCIHLAASCCVHQLAPTAACAASPRHTETGECAGPDSPLELLQHQLPQARSRLVRSFVGDGVHHAAFVGEPRAWQESQAPLMRAALLHMWLRCMSDHVDLDRGQLRDLEIRGFLFVEPRNTQHINSPAAPLLQVSETGSRLIALTQGHSHRCNYQHASSCCLWLFADDGTLCCWGGVVSRACHLQTSHHGTTAGCV